MPEKNTSPSLEGELLEQVSVDFVNGVVCILDNYVLTVHVAKYDHDDFWEVFESEILLFAENVVEEVLEWNHSHQCLHKHYQSFLEEISAECFLSMFMVF